MFVRCWTHCGKDLCSIEEYNYAVISTEELRTPGKLHGKSTTVKIKRLAYIETMSKNVCAAVGFFLSRSEVDENRGVEPGVA